MQFLIKFFRGLSVMSADLKQNKSEEVTISFHYVTRVNKKEGDHIAITDEEFKAVCKGFEELKGIDFKNKNIEFQLKTKSIVPVLLSDKINEKTFCGKYQATYWGHEIQNSEKGKIPADSMNLKPFYFMLYLSDSGRLYISSQYLGNFGSYTSLKNTVLSFILNKNGLTVKSFNEDTNFLSGATAKEIEIGYTRKSKNAFADNEIGNNGAFVFHPGATDDGFSETIINKIAKLATGNLTKTQKLKKITEFVKEKTLFEVDDFEIENCKVIVQHGRKSKILQILKPKEFATRFSIDVTIGLDGHPAYSELKTKVPTLLNELILARKEDD